MYPPPPQNRVEEGGGVRIHNNLLKRRDIQRSRRNSFGSESKKIRKKEYEINNKLWKLAKLPYLE